MGNRARSQAAALADSMLTVLGVAGFLGFLVTARMDDANASPFDAMAYAWFFVFLVLKMCLPWFRSRRAPKRTQTDLTPMRAVASERRWYSSWQI
jgi:predicted MFS family arabinose efflux permease